MPMKMIKVPILSTYFLLVRIVGDFMISWMYACASFVQLKSKGNQFVTGKYKQWMNGFETV